MYLDKAQKREALKRFKQRLTDCAEAKAAYYNAPPGATSDVLKPLRERYEETQFALVTHALICREDGVL